MGIFGIFILPFIIAVFVIILVVTVLANGIFRILGIGGNRFRTTRSAGDGSAYDRRGDTSSYNRGRRESTGRTGEAPSRKIIGDDEGEYVDYEEVK